MAKSRDAFRTISEVAEWLETPAHVLRFWESKFTQIKPVKRAGGRRYYRPADMELLGGIKQLLHEDGMTIKGVQKVLREHGVRHVSSLNAIVVDEDEAMPSTEIIEDAPYVEVEVPDSVVAFPGTEAATETAEPAQTADMFAEPETSDEPVADDVSDIDEPEQKDVGADSEGGDADVDVTSEMPDTPETNKTPDHLEDEDLTPTASPEPAQMGEDIVPGEQPVLAEEYADSSVELTTTTEKDVESRTDSPEDDAIPSVMEDNTPVDEKQELDQIDASEGEEVEHDATIVQSDEPNRDAPLAEERAPSKPVENEESVSTSLDDLKAEDAETPAEDQNAPEPKVDTTPRPALLSLIAQVESLSQVQAAALRPHYDALRDLRNKRHSN
nr:MerR family transcriptional regulator [uncultured Pelagimonas sp.]